MIRAGLAALLMSAVAACGSGPQTYRELETIGSDYQRAGTSPLAGQPDACGAAAHRGLIGIEQSAVDPASLPEGARVICHECSFTEDYRATRLNVFIGADGKVERLTCG